MNNRCHQKLMEGKCREKLPPCSWHRKISKRYPIGSPTELHRRVDNCFYKDLASTNKDLFCMQPFPKLLDIVSNPIDIVASVLIDQNDQKAILLMEDHYFQQETSYTYGKSTIIRNIIHLTPIDGVLRNIFGLPKDKKISSQKFLNKLAKIDSIKINQKERTNTKILTGDITYIGRSKENKLVALAIVGNKEDFVWDLARSAMRGLIDNFSNNDQNIKLAQIELAKKLRVDTHIWADINIYYPIKEIIFIKPNLELDKPVKWETPITQTKDILFNLQRQLFNNPVYLSHDFGYWAIDQKLHFSLVEKLINKGFSELPIIKYLQLENPKDQNVLKQASNIIRDILVT